MNQTIKQKAFITIFLLLTLFLGFKLLIRAINISERNECRTWLEESRTIANYYFTNWQQQQCHAYGINLIKDK